MSEPIIIDRYALFDAIARGGMAAVHLGRLVGSAGFSRTVAIKRLHPQFAHEDEFVAMFVDEARLAARIQHPNVVPTLDVVRTEDELFIVMEFIQGESLSRLFKTLKQRGEAMAPRYALPIIAGSLHGLHAAHTATNQHGEPLQIVHRDVSPQNIIVGIDGAPRVFDFGIAKARGRLHTTETGQVKGKLAYMAPEQLSGGEVGPYTDVYAVGVVLWELLAGRRLYDSRYEAELIGQVLVQRTTPPSAHQPHLPPELDAIVMRALSHDVDTRYGSARAMARELEALGAFALPAELGEWVEDLAGDTLVVRSRLVAEIESNTDVLANLATVSQELPIGRVEGRTLERASDPGPPPPADDADTRVSMAAQPAARPSRGPWPAIALVLLGALVALGAMIVLDDRSPAPPPASASSREEPEEDASATTAPAPLPSASAVPAASATPSASAPPPPVPAAAPSPVSPPPTRQPPRPKSPPSNCSPPYYYDSDGIKHFKPGCL